MITNLLKAAFFAVWTVVGLFLIVLATIGMAGNGTWTENLNLAEAPAQVENESTTQQPAPTEQPPVQQQPPQPTEAQLACISEQVGQDRLAELQQGTQPEDEEAVIIQQCLQS